MPDTRQNQRAYPQTDRQKSGLGFPIAESEPSRRLPAERFSISGSVAMQARDKAK